MPRADDEIDLIELWNALWDGKWLIAAVTGVFTAAALAYAMLATEWYRAEVLLAPAEDKAAQNMMSRFGGLASLAGLSMGTGDTVEAIAVLKSRNLARQFIEERGLITVLLADEWDSTAKQWKSKDPADWPDWRDAVKFFDENVRNVSEDPKTGLVTLSIEWTDSEAAAEWANAIVKRLNDLMRERALLEAKTNVSYLQSEMAATSIVTLQQSIGGLLETELKKLMLARGNEEFSFRVVDRAEPPKLRSKPKRKLTVALGIVVGGFVSAFIVLLRRSARLRKGK